MNRPQFIAILLFGATACLAIDAGCSQNRSGVPRISTAAPLIGKFAGNESCVECHPKECVSHRASRHAATLTLVDSKSLGVLAPKTGPIPGTRYVLRTRGDKFELGVSGRPESFRTIDLAFGSGRFGYSFVCVTGMAIERLRLSYYPILGKWFLHPGEEGFGLYDPPSKFEGGKARNCVDCHSTVLPENTLIPAPKDIGVGCEKCHGPGAAHVAAAKQPGRPNEHMEKISGWGAARINEMCGKCHGKENGENEQLLDVKDTQRFESNAIMQSRCYWESGAKLSCLTCHDPHTNASPDPRHYNEACLNCHGGGKSPVISNQSSVISDQSGKQNDPTVERAKSIENQKSKIENQNPSTPSVHPCPVNPKDGCTGCHMKAGQFFARTPIPTKMTDHYIRPPVGLKR